jgi:hypothetical protein
MAKECGFCCRERTIDVHTFFDMLLYCANRQSASSLSFMSSRLQQCYGIEVSKQAIDKRFNENCVKFVRGVFGEVLRDRYKECLCAYGDDIFVSYHRVRVKDSTKFQLPAAMQKDFPGIGGCAGKAGVRIQFEYDVKNGDILFIEIGKGSANDREDAVKTCHQVEAGDLILRDLGYSGCDVFSAFVEQGAYFLSRLDSRTLVFGAENQQRISFKRLYRQMQKERIQEKELNVLLRADKQLKVRLLVKIVPEEVYEKRLHERERQNKSKSCRKHRKPDSGSPPESNVSDETKARYRFSLLITNIESESLPLSKAFPLYRVRWQIELVFKSWKSSLHVDKIQRMKKERFLALLMAKLILAAIYLQVFFRVQAALTKYGERKKESKAGEKKGKRKGKRKEKKLMCIILSREKVFKTLHGLFDYFIRTLASKRGVGILAAGIQQLLRRNHQLESRKNKLSLPYILELFICETEK